VSWRDEWVGMPEYVQESQKPFKELKLRFETEEAYYAFAELIGQALTPKTKGIWFPKFVNPPRGRWVDET